jgi:hypothetical protein
MGQALRIHLARSEIKIRRLLISCGRLGPFTPELRKPRRAPARADDQEEVVTEADKMGTFYFTDRLIRGRGSYGGCTITNYC